MFILFPFQIKEPARRETIPLANALLIAANIVLFLVPAQSLAVGPGTGIISVVAYAFAHANLAHLLANIWVLWLVGNPVNRRLGNAYYLLAYLGTTLALGVLARLLAKDPALGASGAIYAVLLLFMLLMPSAQVRVAYMVIFPLTLLIGLFSRPRHWLFWFFRFGDFYVRAWFGLILIPLIQLGELFWFGWNWTNVGHLFGLVCGVAIVLLLPERITLRRVAPATNY